MRQNGIGQFGASVLVGAPELANDSSGQHTGGILHYLPSFDGQTIFSIVLGAILTVVTFWFGYRKTIGAQDERQRAASSELCSSVIKRVAVERRAISAEQFSALRWAKAYKLQVQADRLIDFSGALSMALSETVDNSFLDVETKQSVISLIEESRIGAERAVQSQHGSIADKDSYRLKLVSVLGTFSILAGVMFSFVILETKNHRSSWTQPGLDIDFDTRPGHFPLILVTILLPILFALALYTFQLARSLRFKVTTSQTRPSANATLRRDVDRQRD